MGNVPLSFIEQLVQSGTFTTALAVQEAAAEQVNNAQNTSAQTANQSWGKALPTLLGHTRTTCLPLWVGNAIATFDAVGNELDTVDFAVMVGVPGPRELKAKLLKVWFDSVLVYDSSNPLVTTLLGDQLQFIFYDGTQTAPDPLIAALQGDATPAFTGRIYIVFPAVITRALSADLTITQFSKLPEVQAEVIQVADNPSNDAVATAFDGGPQNNITLVLYDYAKGRLYLFHDPNFVDVYDTVNNVFLGTVKLRNFNNNNAFNPGGYLGRFTALYLTNDQNIVVSYENRFVTWSLITGLVINDVTLSNELNSNGASSLLNIGANYFIYCYHTVALLYRDPTSYVVGLISDFNQNVNLGTYGAIADHHLKYDNIPAFTGLSIAYFAGKEGTTLWRLCVSPNASMVVGVTTNDGSNIPKSTTNKPHLLCQLTEQGDQFEAIICDREDTRFVYAIVQNEQNETTLRTYATFYYYNPQTGEAPPKGSYYQYSNYDFVQEIARLKIPPGYFQAVPMRNKLYPVFGYSQAFAAPFVVVNYKNNEIKQYGTGGTLSGDTATTQFASWPVPQIWDTPNRSALYYSSDVLSGAGRLQPSGVVDKINPYKLSDMFTDLTLLADYDLSDVSCVGMDDTVAGLQLNQQVNYTDLMAQLCAAFRVDLLENPDSTIKFQRRLDVESPDYVLNAPQFLSSGSSNNPTNTVGIDRVATNELPTLLQLSFVNKDFGFVVGAATVRRVSYPQPTAFGKSFLALSIPVVMGGTDAVYYAGIALFDMWAGKTNFSINLPPYFFFMEPGDFVEVIRPSGRADLCKVTQVQLGPDHTLAVSLSSISSLRPIPYYQRAVAPGQVPLANLPLSYGTFGVPSPTGVYATVIDNVDLTVADDAANSGVPLYFATSVASDIYTQDGVSPPVKVGTTTASVMGSVTGNIPNTKLPHQTNTVLKIHIVMIAGAVLGVSDIEFRAGHSVVAIGAPGRWEILWFRDVAMNMATGVLTLSTLLRGRMGTEVAAGRHQDGDLAIFGPAALLRAGLPYATLGRTLTVYTMPPGVAAQPNGGVYDKLLVSGAALLPRAPLFPRAVKQSNGDIAITWFRQDRENPASFWNDPPLSEATEAYVLTLPTLTAGQVGSRVVNCNAPNYTYAAADQATDGNTSVKRLMLNITQVSSTVGTGTPYKGFVYVK